MISSLPMCSETSYFTSVSSSDNGADSNLWGGHDNQRQEYLQSILEQSLDHRERSIANRYYFVKYKKLVKYCLQVWEPMNLKEYSEGVAGDTGSG